MRWARGEGRLSRRQGKWLFSWNGRQRPVVEVLEGWWESGEWWSETGSNEERQVMRLALEGGAVVEVSVPLARERQKTLDAPTLWPGPVRLEMWLD